MIEEARLQVGDTSVPYLDTGETGHPLILLHAASGNGRMWVHQFAAFAQAGFRCIAIDWRQSSPGYIPGSNSTVLIDAVLARLGVERAHILGTAAGGGTAFQYALAHPGKVASLVIANSTGFVTDDDYLDMERRLRPAPHFNALPVEFRELGPSYRAADPEGVARWKAMSHTFIPAAPTSSVAAACVCPAQGANAVVTWARLETLEIPTLLLTGDADLYVPPAVLRMFAARIRHADIEIVAEAGHSVFWEQPERFNRSVLAFLRKQGRQPDLTAVA